MKILWNHFRKIGKRIVSIQATILLSIVFFILVIPISLVRKYGKQKERMVRKSYWVIRPNMKKDLSWAMKQ